MFLWDSTFSKLRTRIGEIPYLVLFLYTNKGDAYGKSNILAIENNSKKQRLQELLCNL